MNIPASTRYSTIDHLLKMVRWSMIAVYLATCIHHVDEGLGLVFGFRLYSLLSPVTFGLPLLITLGLLDLWQKTGRRLVLVVFSIIALLWWVGGIGIGDGLYNHSLNLVLYFARVPVGVIRQIYPQYVPPVHTSTVMIPCDGATFCVLTPNLVLYLAAAILSLVASGFLTVAVVRLIRHGWHVGQTAGRKLPDVVAVGVSLSLVAFLVAFPLLAFFMSTGSFSFFLPGVSFLVLSLLGVGIAFGWLRKESTNSSLMETPIAASSSKKID